MTSPKSAWDQGVTLSEALEMYSSDELWRAFETLHEKLLPTIPADHSDEPIKWDPQSSLTHSPMEEFGKYMGLHKKLKNEIISLLRIGELLGVGFFRPKYRGAEPIWISANNWNEGCRISWDSSDLWIHGKIFMEVRVVRPRVPITISRDSAAQAIQLAPSPRRKRSRRPTRANEI